MTKMSALKNVLKPGLARRDAYARIRAQELVAFNRDVLPNDGDWPEPGSPVKIRDKGNPFGPTTRAHPYAIVSISEPGICLWSGDIAIYFDQKDRISHIREDKPSQECP